MDKENTHLLATLLDTAVKLQLQIPIHSVTWKQLMAGFKRLIGKKTEPRQKKNYFEHDIGARWTSLLENDWGSIGIFTYGHV